MHRGRAAAALRIVGTLDLWTNEATISFTQAGLLTKAFKAVTRYLKLAFWIKFVNWFLAVRKGKSFSEALILASTNPQYDKRLFIELQVQYKLCTEIVICFCFDIQSNLCTQHVLNMFSTCSQHVLSLEFSCTELVIQWTIFWHTVGLLMQE